MSKRLGGILLFLTFSVLVANPKKLLYTVANPARGLLNREKRIKEVWQHTPPSTPHTCCSFGEKSKNKKRGVSTGPTQVSVGLGSVQENLRLSSARRLGTRPMGVASQNSTLPSAITNFPVSLLLSSPGDV